MGIDEVNYAGILPSYLYQKKLISSDSHNKKPGRVVFNAYLELTQQKFQRNVPVILLGGAGSVGTYIHLHLKAHNIETHVVDPRISVTTLPNQLIGKEVILIDTARKGTLDGLEENLWPGLAILNETYPEPPSSFTNKLKTKGIDTYHLSGVAGRCLPSLPHGYSNAIPCCAIHTDIEDASPVVVPL